MTMPGTTNGNGTRTQAPAPATARYHHDPVPLTLEDELSRHSVEPDTPMPEELGLQHSEEAIPHGLRDLGVVGWLGALLMVGVLSLITYGLVLPWLGLRQPFVWNPLH